VSLWSDNTSDKLGTGIHGLAMLKTYREVHPNASIVVLDKGTSIGGVWAKDRLYPGLHTNNHFQTFVLHPHIDGSC
jgi:cation diffusion facilitator CzcD-associated flavoprotein CzcO